jgi:hypothetical protein
MRLESQPEARASSERAGSDRAGSDLERRYPVALALYALLGVLVWFTIGDGAVPVFGRPVEIRLVALLIVGSFALRTVLARQADRIRHGRGESSSSPRDL